MKYLLLLVFVLIITAFAVIKQVPDRKLHIYFCDVGQGDAILVVKGSTQILIDAGPDNAVESCLGKYMPFWDRTIEVAMMTHADSDHSFGFIQLLTRYTIHHFFISPVEGTSVEYKKIKEELNSMNLTPLIAHRGQIIRVAEVSLSIISPLSKENERGDTNDNCIVSEVSYRSFSGLFACDISPQSEDILILHSFVPHAYLLKVPHHGSKNGLTEAFLSQVKPEVAVISVGAKNRYKLPDDETIQLLHNHSIKIYRTDLQGDIEVTTDGKTVWSK